MMKSWHCSGMFHGTPAHASPSALNPGLAAVVVETRHIHHAADTRADHCVRGVG
ncbi:unnamed protein product, partial [Gadus morhua 'NCC']